MFTAVTCEVSRNTTGVIQVTFAYGLSQLELEGACVSMGGEFSSSELKLGILESGSVDSHVDKLDIIGMSEEQAESISRDGIFALNDTLSGSSRCFNIFDSNVIRWLDSLYQVKAS